VGLGSGLGFGLDVKSTSSSPKGLERAVETWHGGGGDGGGGEVVEMVVVVVVERVLERVVEVAVERVAEEVVRRWWRGW
jgi:hypothetical protein